MKNLLYTFLLQLIVIAAIAQDKKTLTFDDILQWNRITETVISNDGNTIVYKAEPWKGNSVLKITNLSGDNLLNVVGGTNAEITNDSRFSVFTIQPKEEKVKELKLKDTKAEDLPKNQLGIYNLHENKLDTISQLISYKVPKKWSGWIAYQVQQIFKHDSLNDELKKESEDNGYTLILKNLESNEILTFPFVKNYQLAKENKTITFVSTGDDQELDAGVYSIDLTTKRKTEIFLAKGDYKSLSINEAGSKVAFIANTTDSKNKKYSLFLWNRDGGTLQVVNNKSAGIPEGWAVSPDGKITFAKETDRIFFGLAPQKPEKDTTILEEERPKLDVWHWNEPVLHSQQLNTLNEDIKKSYLTVYYEKDNKLVQLEREHHTGLQLINNGDADLAFAWSNLPYSVQTMWEGYPEHFDFYLIDMNSGKEEIIKRDCRAYPQVSPEGRYIYWYNYSDTTWNTYNLDQKQEYTVTTPDVIWAANEINDIPNPPNPYGTAGWLANDEALLVYDRYDIWKVDPENKTLPVNITKSGRTDKTNYRILDFENFNRKIRGDEEIGFNKKEPVYLKGHNEITRAEGYYQISLAKSQTPKALLIGKFELSSPIKAKDEEVFVYTKETFQEFPDLLVTKNLFKKSTKISYVNPQQEEFLWGTKKLYSWTSLDGLKLEGLLIKPANFDPNKKYPMIVNFYEKSSQNLYGHHIPEAHRSTVDYHYYSSNGYIIFNPDVYYKEGYPGESAYNCVMPGITQLISEGFVDENHIAAQGHSWGGYQVAYLATRTNLFAAIESGAPVVNMFSAYGGIRLWSGRNRSFQYEHTQSRIGKTIWESPLRYLENSPLFTADKITTPMLIMHNEDDGAVPFSQGIEFFIALRRMGKKAWLLNYNEADHWPTLVRDKYDFQVRLAQFFDHYLKEKPMPIWMKEGIPAVDKEYELGY